MTKYEVFLKRGAGGYNRIGVEEAHSPKKALDQVCERVIELADGQPVDTGGEYLIVPVTNATYLRRGLRSEYFTEEYDPDHPETAQEVLA